MKNRACYHCGAPATSTEHVPPKCIFPERKDAFGVDHRKELITVPSCDQHNLAKSKEDEFLMACLTPVVGNNGAGFIQTKTKLRRSFEYRDGSLLKHVMPDAKPATLTLPDGTKFPILVGEANMPRLVRALESVARGLYFHARNERFIGKVHIMPMFIRFPRDPDLTFTQQLADLLASQERNWVDHGSNPEIFRFQIAPRDQYGLTAMRMFFFRGSVVHAAFQPEGVKLPFRTLDEATPENPLRIEITIEDET